jgi:hypothetical protein
MGGLAKPRNQKPSTFAGCSTLPSPRSHPRGHDAVISRMLLLALPYRGSTLFDSSLT